MARKRKAKQKARNAAPRVNRWARQREWRSGFEKGIRVDLLKRGIPFEYEPKEFAIRVAGSPGHVCASCGGTKINRLTRYTPDFYLPKENLWVEAKGKLDARGKRAILAFREQYPEEPLYVLFQRDNWTTRIRREKYTGWCARHNVTCAVGPTIPQEWILGS